jgi:hypothetical protein
MSLTGRKADVCKTVAISKLLLSAQCDCSTRGLKKSFGFAIASPTSAASTWRRRDSVTSSRDISVGVNSAPRTIHSRHWLRAICHAGHSRSGCYCPRRPTISRQNFSIIASVALNFGFVPSSVPESMALTHDHHPHPLCRTPLPPAERSGFSDPACD